MGTKITLNGLKEIIEKCGECKVPPKCLSEISKEELDDFMKNYKVELVEDNTTATCYYLFEEKIKITLPSVIIEKYIHEYIKKHYNIIIYSECFIPFEISDLEDYMIKKTRRSGYYVCYYPTDNWNEYNITIFICEKKEGVCELKKGIEYYVGGKFTIMDTFKFEIVINEKL